MVKRLLALLCVFVILLSLASCSSLKEEKGGETTTKKKNTTTETTGPAEDPEGPISSGSAPYAAAIETFEKVLNGNSSVMEDMAPPEAWRAFEKDEGKDVEAYMAMYEERYETSISKRYAEEYGNDFKFTLTVIDEEECDDNTLLSFKEILKEDYNISQKDVKSGYFLTASLKVSGSKGKHSEPEEIAAIQIGEEWYLLYWDKYDGELDAEFVIFM